VKCVGNPLYAFLPAATMFVVAIIIHSKYSSSRAKKLSKNPNLHKDFLFTYYAYDPRYHPFTKSSILTSVDDDEAKLIIAERKKVRAETGVIFIGFFIIFISISYVLC
jgi:hypothetical protein